MSDTVEIVRKVIERDGGIMNGLGRGFINTAALARYIEEQASKEGHSLSRDAVVGAIRRYPIKNRLENRQNIGRLIKKLTMRNKIVDIALVNVPEIAESLGKVASLIDYGRGETFRIVAGVEPLRVVIDEKNLDKIAGVITKKYVRKVVSNLAEIIVSLGEIAETTPGVVSTVTTELAMNGINMIEFMSCIPELIIVIDEKDALRSYESLEKLSKGMFY